MTAPMSDERLAHMKLHTMQGYLGNDRRELIAEIERLRKLHTKDVLTHEPANQRFYIDQLEESNKLLRQRLQLADAVCEAFDQGHPFKEPLNRWRDARDLARSSR